MTAQTATTTEEAEAILIVFGSGALASKVFVGRPQGSEARRHFGLDDADLSGRSVRVVVPDTIFSITSSFFLGLFGDSIRKAGSKESFLERFHFECPSRIIADTVAPGIERALFERKPLVR